MYKLRKFRKDWLTNIVHNQYVGCRKKFVAFFSKIQLVFLLYKNEFI